MHMRFDTSRSISSILVPGRTSVVTGGIAGVGVALGGLVGWGAAVGRRGVVGMISPSVGIPVLGYKEDEVGKRDGVLVGMPGVELGSVSKAIDVLVAGTVWEELPLYVVGCHATN